MTLVPYQKQRKRFLKLGGSEGREGGRGGTGGERRTERRRRKRMERTSYQFKEEVSQTGVSWVATDTVQLGTIHLKTQSLVDVKVLETEIMLKSYIRA